MSLDKILGTKTPKKPEKKSKQSSEPSETITTPDNKHYLKCTKPQCKGTRTLRKKIPEDKDLVCPLCGAELKHYTPRKKTTTSAEDSDELELEASE